MYTRIYSFLEKYQIIYNRQFGFRSRHSTDHALCSLIELIKNFIDNGNFVCGIFIDLQKAFDTVDHKIMMQKLWYYGIRGTTYEWLRSFLLYRKQFVSINGYESGYKMIKCGVPQGSTLGPLLFLLYINDLNTIFKKSIIHHFADDTNLIFANKKLSTIENVMNYELKHLVEWLRTNKLSLNESKTELIFFHHANKKIENISIKLNKVKLQACESVNYLGIIIDKFLSWDKQIKNICQKISKANGVIAKIRHVVPLNITKSVYYSLFYSHVTYGCLVWSYSTKRNLDKIVKLQKKCTRIITFSEYQAHTNPLFNALKFLKFEDIVSFEILKFMFDVKNKQTPKVITKFFHSNMSVHDHFTRANQNFHIRSVNSSQYGLRSLRTHGVSLWNNFVSNHQTIANISFRNPFTSKVKEILLIKYLSDNVE